MGFSVSLALDKRVKNSDDSYTINVQIIVNRKMTSIATEYSVAEKDWDNKKRQIRNTSQIAGNISRINNILNKKRAEVMDKVTALHDNGNLNKLPLKEIRGLITNEHGTKTVFQLYDKMIAELTAIGNVGNARSYKMSLQSVKTFTKEKDFTFIQLTYAWLKEYEKFYLSKEGNTKNGLGVYLRALRAVCNRAIKERIIKREDYPFQHYKIVKEPTIKRALTETQIEAIRNFDPGKRKREALAKDVFLTSFYLVGISFMDIAHLKVCAIHNGRIAYKRQKTKQLINIKITMRLQDVLDKYLKGKGPEDYIFPIIKSKSAELIYRDVKNSMKRYNKCLKVIADECKIEENLTGYWSRHSWATIAKRKGVSTAIISESLGHTTEKTTQIYLDSFEDSVIDAANELVTG